MRYPLFTFVSLVASILSTDLCVFAQSSEKLGQEKTQFDRPLANADQVQNLLRLFESSHETGQSVLVIEALQAMMPFSNEEFSGPALDCIEYRASKEDRSSIIDLAREQNRATKDHVEAMIIRDENQVRIEAARLLANFPTSKHAGVLLKQVSSRALNDRTELAGTFIEALGWMGYENAESEVFRHAKKSSDMHIIRGCVRYFGHIHSKRYDVARHLAQRLDPPERPKSSEQQTERSVSPHTLWRHEMNIFNFIKSDISATLRVMTGHRFPPTDQGALEALKHIQDNRRTLELR